MTGAIVSTIFAWGVGLLLDANIGFEPLMKLKGKWREAPIILYLTNIAPLPAGCRSTLAKKPCKSLLRLADSAKKPLQRKHDF